MDEGMRFMSGEKTFMYDEKTHPETLQTMNSLQYDFNVYKKETDQRCCEIELRVGSNQNTISAISEEHDNTRQMLWVFLRSPLVRFLNFFGCWYIYTDDGRVFLNTEENAWHGKVPFLTRVKRGFAEWLDKTFHKEDEDPESDED